MIPEQKKEFLQEFLDFIVGVEEIVLCVESNDPDSDQQFNENATSDEALISAFLDAKEGCK